MSLDTIKDEEVEGEKIILRADLNMPIEDGEPQKTIRFDHYMETIKELSQRGGKILVLAHQGRPGRNDFISLDKHRRILENELDEEVKFIKQFFTDKVKEEVKCMDNGEVALLENVRFLSEELKNFNSEKHSQSHFVQNIAHHFDLFVNDAFSAAHRSHASLVGFNPLISDYAGPVMNKEIRSCQRVLEEFEHGVLVLGGEKPVDIISMMEEEIEEADKVLLGGIPGEAALIAEGNQLEKKKQFLKEHSINLKLNKLKKLLEEHSEKIETPKDLTTESGSYKPEKIPQNEITWDIGPKTIKKYTKIVQNAENILMKGPMGAFDQGYEEGTKEIVDAIADNQEAYTVLGGGHTSSLVKRFGHEIQDFDHVSIAGGAFVKMMSGKQLPAIKALKE